MAGLDPLREATASQFDAYISLFLRWNQRLNLSSDRDEDSLIARHIIESIAVSRALPVGIVSLLDFGSGGGLPGIPIALCRPEIAVTLAESQGKKAAFLQEATRTVGLTAAVYPRRAETLQITFDCVVLRAVDKMPKAIATAIPLVASNRWLALMTTLSALAANQLAAGPAISWSPPILLPASESRLLALGQKLSS
jgi:16S rRNA (guanine527-N7)-methyltransferase